MFGKFFQRRGTKAASFEFTFAVDSVSSQASDGLELGRSFCLFIEKGDKNVKSGDHKSFLQGSEIVVTVNEKLNMSVTLYENSDGKYQEKLATILLRQRRAGAAGLKNGNDAFITVGTIPLQLESYANTAELKVSLPLQLCSFDGCMVNMSITSTNSTNSSNSSISQTPSKSPSLSKEKTSTKSKSAASASDSVAVIKSGVSTQTKGSTSATPTKNTSDNFDDFDTTSNKNTDPFDANIQQSSLSDKNPFDEDENPFSNPTVSTGNSKIKTAEVISNSVNNNSIAHALSQLRDSEKQVNMLRKENKQIKEDLDALKSKNDWNISEISRLEELVEMLQNENRALKSQPSSGKPNHAMKSLLQKYSTHIAKLELKLVEVSLQKI